MDPKPRPSVGRIVHTGSPPACRAALVVGSREETDTPRGRRDLGGSIDLVAWVPTSATGDAAVYGYTSGYRLGVPVESADWHWPERDPGAPA